MEENKVEELKREVAELQREVYNVEVRAKALKEEVEQTIVPRLKKELDAVENRMKRLDETVPLVPEEIGRKLDAVEERMDNLDERATNIAQKVYPHDMATMCGQIKREVNELKREVKELKDNVGDMMKTTEQVSERDSELERNLKQRFPNLREVRVSINTNLGPMAAGIFKHLVRPAEAMDKSIGIGLSGGTTIRDMVENIKWQYKNLIIRPLACPGLPKQTGSVNTVVDLLAMGQQSEGVTKEELPLAPKAMADVLIDTVNLFCLDDILIPVATEIHYVFTGVGGLQDKSTLREFEEWSEQTRLR